MLETLIVVLLLLWLLGLATSYSFGGLIHLLLLIAIVVTLIRVIRGRRV
ncbi:MAG TPA: lmo0937 family membrane protein [Permianibacter sp.]|nr:lmo0937 family membrane protein [Permianibacter sp.]